MSVERKKEKYVEDKKKNIGTEFTTSGCSRLDIQQCQSDREQEFVRSAETSSCYRREVNLLGHKRTGEQRNRGGFDGQRARTDR